ncbi:YmfQ family protein [Pseudomonas sp. GD03721]|nr:MULTISPECIES: putative phage tail protein [unclassified Pseudomonas]MDH1442070.1 YmfQ family protein [Pseudomonas sp. GD03722]WGG02710.1 YmfQ family protein [Pseudomonas sp. GD03721]WGG06878.1 YmfQ family protein [Pseudomonas sp. GD03919]
MAVRTAADYHDHLRALLPPGPAWDADLVPEVDAALRGLAPELARADSRSSDLLNEADPLTLHEMLPDWERVMQLPDPCLGESPTLDDRKKAMRKRLTGLGGQSAAFFEQLAREQGCPNAKVVAHRAPRFGRARFGRSHFGTWAQQHMWTLYAGERLAGGRRFGVSYWGERFGANPAQALECLVRRAAPAHTLENILYEEAP